MSTMISTSAKTTRVTVAKMPRIKPPPFRVSDAGTDVAVIHLKDERLVELVREYCHDADDSLWSDEPSMSAMNVLENLGQLERALRDHSRQSGLRQLVNYARELNDSNQKTLRNMLDHGVVTFAGLRELLKSGVQVVVTGAHLQGARVVHTRLHRNMFGASLEVNLERISSTGRDLVSEPFVVWVQEFPGAISLDKLQVRPLTPADRDDLTERGRVYQQVALGNSYQVLQGHMEVQRWWDWTAMRSTGRVMVDVATYHQFNDNYHRRGEQPVTEVTDDVLWMTDAYVYGFSFVTKQWGRFPVANLSDVTFQESAFDQLVMNPEQKRMIRALVADNAQGFSDIIQGKGGGCIFLLHGEPGVGKTLTAEAVSELLHRPLYSVSVGELGSTAADLETNLRRILDVSQIWNAVILIDEADIFLEQRATGDVVRNQLCSIFLKLLEYHQGVLFLTTNRVRDFDPAFFSRISIALRYEGLDQSARQQVWINLLAAAGIDGLDPVSLSKLDLNGRQIKNTIRLAQSLARQEGVSVQAGHVYRCAEVGARFSAELNS